MFNLNLICIKIKNKNKKNDNLNLKNICPTMEEKYFENDNYVFFNSSYLSQSHYSNITIDGILYYNSEQRVCHVMALTFGDKETAAKILSPVNYQNYKNFIVNIKNFNASHWNKIVDRVVYEANLAKFMQDSLLKILLLNTNDKIIVNCSPNDLVFGNGLNIQDSIKTMPENWKGKNRLGKILMRIRDAVKK